jgi:hypothetical protein
MGWAGRAVWIARDEKCTQVCDEKNLKENNLMSGTSKLLYTRVTTCYYGLVLGPHVSKSQIVLNITFNLLCGFIIFS